MVGVGPLRDSAVLATRPNAKTEAVCEFIHPEADYQRHDSRDSATRDADTASMLPVCSQHDSTASGGLRRRRFLSDAHETLRA